MVPSLVVQAAAVLAWGEHDDVELREVNASHVRPVDVDTCFRPCSDVAQLNGVHEMRNHDFDQHLAKILSAHRQVWAHTGNPHFELHR